MSNADLDFDDFRALMDRRGHKPSDFQVAASPDDPAEGELGPSRRTVTVTHTPTGIARVYAYRTWLRDLEPDLLDGVFEKGSHHGP